MVIGLRFVYLHFYILTLGAYFKKAHCYERHTTYCEEDRSTQHSRRKYEYKDNKDNA